MEGRLDVQLLEDVRGNLGGQQTEVRPAAQRHPLEALRRRGDRLSRQDMRLCERGNAALSGSPFLYRFSGPVS